MGERAKRIIEGRGGRITSNTLSPLEKENNKCCKALKITRLSNTLFRFKRSYTTSKIVFTVLRATRSKFLLSFKITCHSHWLGMVEGGGRHPFINERYPSWQKALTWFELDKYYCKRWRVCCILVYVWRATSYIHSRRPK